MKRFVGKILFIPMVAPKKLQHSPATPTYNPSAQWEWIQFKKGNTHQSEGEPVAPKMCTAKQNNR